MIGAVLGGVFATGSVIWIRLGIISGSNKKTPRGTTRLGFESHGRLGTTGREGGGRPFSRCFYP